jgi:hypothetical protein
MPEPVTNEQRGLSSSSRGTGKDVAGSGERTTNNRNTESKGTLAQQEPFAAHAGPLAKMTAAVARAERVEASRQAEARLDKLEQEMRARLERVPVELASAQGARAARLVHGIHQARLKGGKEGPGFGVVWLAKEAQEKAKGSDAQARYYQRRMAELEGKGLELYSCLTMFSNTLPFYAEALDAAKSHLDIKSDDKKKDMEGVLAKASDARGKDKQFVFGGRGTVVLEELHSKLQFETIHVDAAPRAPDPLNYTSDEKTRKSGTVPNHPAPVVGAVTGNIIDTRVKVDRFVKLGKKMSPESRKLWDSLKKVDYAVGVADSGMHTFVLTSGKVYEVHWDEGPGSPRLTSTRPVENLFKSFGSLVIAVPPKMLNKE